MQPKETNIVHRPDDELVAAVAGSYGIQWQEIAEQGDAKSVGTVTYYGGFPPTSRLTGKGGVDRTASGYYAHLGRALVLYGEEDYGLGHQPVIEDLTRQKDPTITGLSSNQRREDCPVEVVFELDPKLPIRPVPQEVYNLQQAVRGKVAIAIRNVLSDQTAMKNVDGEVKEDLGQIRWAERDRISYLRREIETPKDKKQFVEALKVAAKFLGHEDLHIDLLPENVFMERLSNGRFRKNVTCYTQAGETIQEFHGPVAEVPMSKYGTRDLLPLENVWEILADLIAYHQIAKGDTAEVETLSSANLEKLQALKVKFGVDVDGDGTFQIVERSNNEGEHPEMDKSLADMAREHAQLLKPKPPEPEELPELHGKPNPDLVDAFMSCFTVTNGLHAHDVQHVAQKPHTVIWGGVTRNDTFIPPRRLWEIDGRLSEVVKSFWEDASEIIFREAQDISVGAPGANLNSLAVGGITSVYLTGTTDRKRRHVYWDIDTAQPFTEEEIIQAEKELRDKIMAMIRDGVERVLADSTKMNAITRTAAIKRGLVRNVQFKDQAARINYIRDQVELPEERERFLDVLRKAIALLGYTDVDVTLLSAEDALFEGCVALYKSSTKKRRAEVCIPMSHYGTTQLESRTETWEKLAHELSHHEMRRRRKDGDLAHGVSQDTLYSQILGRLNRLEVDLDGDEVILREPKVGSSTVDEAQLKKAITTTLDELKKHAQAELEAQIARTKADMVEATAVVLAAVDTKRAEAIATVDSAAETAVEAAVRAKVAEIGPNVVIARNRSRIALIVSILAATLCGGMAIGEGYQAITGQSITSIFDGSPRRPASPARRAR